MTCQSWSPEACLFWHLGQGQLDSFALGLAPVWRAAFLNLECLSLLFKLLVLQRYNFPDVKRILSRKDTQEKKSRIYTVPYPYAWLTDNHTILQADKLAQGQGTCHQTWCPGFDLWNPHCEWAICSEFWIYHVITCSVVFWGLMLLETKRRESKVFLLLRSLLGISVPSFPWYHIICSWTAFQFL